jgi:Tol biopolymer transport system component
LVLGVAVSIVVSMAGPAAANGATTERISVANDGTQANDYSAVPSISADGRYVAFPTQASTLVPGDTNNAWDVFLRDRQTGTTTRISVAGDGSQGDNDSYAPALTPDGRYVAFYSYASNLVAGDTNGRADIFVRDRWAGTNTRVSFASDGSQGNDRSVQPVISADGRYIAFWSYASNLVPSDTNGVPDVFLRDRQTGTTTRVSVASDGTQGNDSSLRPAISADGRYITFWSDASNLVPGDTNGVADVFVWDRQTGTTTRVSLASDGSQANNRSVEPAINADGRYIVFWSFASNLVPGDTNNDMDVFVRDRQTGTTTRVSLASDGSQGNRYSVQPAISPDGRYVTFYSAATNLVPGDTNDSVDVFRRDRWAGTTTRVSVASDGGQANSQSFDAVISADGRYVAFASSASNLVPGDTNNITDVFVRKMF